MTAPLAAESLRVRLGGRTVVDDVSLALAPGAVVGLVGPNGAGKTSLMRALARLLPPVSGRVRLDGADADAVAPDAFARAVAYLPQAASVHWPVTVEVLVGLGRLPHQGAWRGPSEADRAAVARAMAAVDIADLADRPAQELSGGEAARVLLARALATEPRVLLADEPAVGLDPGHQLDVMAHLRRLAAAGTAVAVVLHDLTLAARFCDRLVLLSAGRILADGTPRAVLTAETLAAGYGVRARIEATPDGLFVLPVARTVTPADR